MSLRFDGQLDTSDVPFEIPGEVSLWIDFVGIVVRETALVCARLLHRETLACFRGKRAENAVTGEIFKEISRHLSRQARDDSLPLYAVQRSNLTKSDREPDLVIRHHAWEPEKHYFCWESKCVRRPDSESLCRDYDKKGIQRYRDGIYSQDVQHAGMLAYVIEGDFEKCSALINEQLEAEQKLSAADFLSGIPIFSSVHPRKNVEEILLTHLFLEL